jgi:hypothetical protein
MLDEDKAQGWLEAKLIRGEIESFYLLVTCHTTQCCRPT